MRSLSNESFMGYQIHHVDYPLQPHAVLFSNEVEKITVEMVNDAVDYMIGIIAKKNPLIEKYQTAKKVLRTAKMILMNKQVASRPSGTDLKTAVDVIKEIKNQMAASIEEKEHNEWSASICKLVIDGFGYSNSWQ